MDKHNDLTLHLRPSEGKILVEELADGVTTCKEITAKVLLDCIGSSLFRPQAMYATGLLPPHCLAVAQNDESIRLLVEYPQRYADITLYDTSYPAFPLPRLVFAYQMSHKGKVSSCNIGVIADEVPKASTTMYRWPFSNVSQSNGGLCIGCNPLPIYQSLAQTATLPALLLSIPNNFDSYHRDNSCLDLEYRDLLEHLKDKDPAYYYESVLVPSGKTLQDFMRGAALGETT